MAVSKCPCSTFTNAMFKQMPRSHWFLSINSQYLQPYWLLQQTSEHTKIQSHKDKYAHTTDILAIFSNQLNKNGGNKSGKVVLDQPGVSLGCLESSFNHCRCCCLEHKLGLHLSCRTHIHFHCYSKAHSYSIQNFHIH